MDISAEIVCIPQTREALPRWVEGDAYLAGGTWLFSEPQPVRRLVDLTALAWPSLHANETGLVIAATCRIAELYAFAAPPAWQAASLVPQCCEALLGSFKIWNAATVGGNICLALPAGPMTALAVALDGVCTIWTPHGERRIAAADFVLGDRRTALAPGEILRSIFIPVAAWRWRTAFQRASLNDGGRSAALLIGTLARDGRFALTITASTPRPLRLAFASVPERAALAAAILDAVADAWFDDVHGAPDWRRHMTLRLAEELRAALCA